MWYGELDQISNIGDLVKNIDVPMNGIQDGFCLSLRQPENANPFFEFKLQNCDSKMSTICRIETPKKTPPRKPPRFPCISKEELSRGKREAAADYPGNDPGFYDITKHEGIGTHLVTLRSFSFYTTK